MPIDLLYVITDLNLGGVPLHLHRLAVAMRQRGHGVTVVSLSPPGPVAKRLQADGVTVLSCQAAGGWDFRVIPRLSRVLRETRPSLVHSFLFHANLACRFAAPSAGFPASRLLCEIQTVEVERQWHLWVDRRTYDLCRLTIGNSPSVLRHLTEQAGIPMDRLRLIRGGVDPSVIRAARPIDRGSLGLPADAKMVFWAGRLDPVKGLHLLIDAIRQLDDSHVHLCLAGDGPLRESLERQVVACGIARRVHFLGPRQDVASLLKAADVFAFPSRTEGLPNALLEAMAAGCAIVATDVPGNRDLIEHDRTGLLVPYNDTQALTQAIRRGLDDSVLAQRLRQGAAEAIDRHWRIDRTHDAYAGLYGEVLSNRPPTIPR